MPSWSRSSDTVRAAGAIVVRDGTILLVSRAKYGDWSFPKGKCEPGESDEACALRELEEETGLRVRLGERLGETSYRDAAGRPKVVVYFRAEADGAAGAAAEVAEIRWVSPAEAAPLLTWERDRELLAAVAGRL